MKCPNCGSETSGAFCAECGAPQKGAKCRECSSALLPGSNFCTNCGAAVREGTTRRTSTLPWIVAGTALVAFVVVLMWPSLQGDKSDADDGRVPLSQMAGAEGAGGGSPPPLTGTPREQADRLFNRIMTEQAGGNTAKAQQFLPMALQAYQMAGDLDEDAMYHVALLQAIGEDYKASRETAERVLVSNSTHLLALSAAMTAADKQGDKASAKKFAQRFLSAYDSELAKKLPEYEDHGRVLPDLKSEAERIVK